MSSARSYLRGLYKKFSLLGAWPPNQRIELGEVGVLEDGVFRRVTNLARFGVPYQPVSGGQRGSLDYSEGTSVSVGVDLGAKATGVPGMGAGPSAGVRVKLSKAGSFLFTATGVMEWSIADVIGIENAVLAEREAGRWDPSWVIIVRVLQVDGLTVILGESDGAEVGLAGRGAVQAGAVNLADASLGLSVAHASGDSLRFMAERGLTPLYQALRLNRRMFKKDRLETEAYSFAEEDVMEPVGLEFEEEEANANARPE